MRPESLTLLRRFLKLRHCREPRNQTRAQPASPTAQTATTQLAYPCQIEGAQPSSPAFFPVAAASVQFTFKESQSPAALSSPRRRLNHLYVDPVPVLLICPGSQDRHGIATSSAVPAQSTNVASSLLHRQPDLACAVDPFSVQPVLALPRRCSHRSIRDQSSPASMPYTTTTSCPAIPHRLHASLCQEEAAKLEVKERRSQEQKN
ncbi:hypothetical protein M0R45_009222 [Rubus argutus]|uniref:Uncharacterized protein n=1 Tax=Rubus argutus TaxID=59490 RepID=A0AAW1Y5X6_RUBAR